MRESEVILVNEDDEAMGVMEKMEAHRLGLLHRAFSVFIFDSRGRMLLQQRASAKYHGGKLWTNACCSHPAPGEDTEAAALRRMKEELGFSTKLHKLFDFVYRAEVENNLVEHEYDHVFTGEYDGPMHPNPEEVSDLAFQDMESILWSVQNQPEKFTSWFRMAMPRIEAWWKTSYGAAHDR